MALVWNLLFSCIGLTAAYTILETPKIHEVKVEDVQVGKVFLYPNNWGEVNPFKELEADTITVLAVKEGYMLYSKPWRDTTLQFSVKISGVIPSLKKCKLNY